jgi:hypothetical protein
MTIPKFAFGGLVGALSDFFNPRMPALRFASGGMVPARAAASQLRPVNVTIGGQQYGMFAQHDVADSLVRVAAQQQVRSAGRRASYWGRS